MSNRPPLQDDLPVEVAATIRDFSPEPRGQGGSHTLTTANPGERIARTWVNPTSTSSSEGVPPLPCLATSFWSSVEPPT